MKYKLRKAIIISLLCAAAVCISAGCNITDNTGSNSSENKGNSSMTAASTTSDSEASSSGEKEESIPDISEEESKEEQSSEQSEEEASQPEQSEESKEEESSEPSEEESMTESQAAEVSIEGYQFDDEQIVKDYHTATEFTSNEEFNKLFADNALDTAYQQELQSADTINSMRQTTISYADQWKTLSTTAYDTLSEKLTDRPEEKEKLEQSQNEWIMSLAETESSFNSEASGGGTEGLLAADAAMMNYYKGRAAVLLEQIYELDGTIDLSAFGL